MRSKLIVALLAFGGMAGMTGLASAGGGGAADTKVTIKAEGTDLSGKVKSDKPRRCAKDRKVVVFRVRGGGDERFAMDTAEKNGDQYEWSTGNTGQEGRFYAKVRRIDGCKGDTSRTVRAEAQ